MRVYDLIRNFDVTGISGTGPVAQVVEFDNGKAVIAWNTPSSPKSVTVYDDLTELRRVHCHGANSILVLILDIQDAFDGFRRILHQLEALNERMNKRDKEEAK